MYQEERLSIKDKDRWINTLQKDNVYVTAKVEKTIDLCGLPVVNGYSRAIVSEGKIVNFVSPSYGFLPNEKFFYEFEHKLIEADVQYVTRSINRADAHFAVDYILNDPSFHINIKSGKGSDKIIPMIRATNSYGGGPTTGKFGLFREICTNGLHVAETQVGFGVRHKSNVQEVVMPNIKELVAKFMENEFYSLHKKFELLAETPIKNLNEFVKVVASELSLFTYAAKAKKGDELAAEEPGTTAKEILNIIAKESEELGTEPTLWLGYNAFNAYIHADKKSFEKQESRDMKLFNHVVGLMN